MNVTKVVVDRAKARELYREYKKHQHYSAPIDQAIQRTYQLLAQGRTVIQAFASVKAAGADAHGLPKLAIMRADQRECFVDVGADGHVRFSNERWPRRSLSKNLHLPAGTLPTRNRVSGKGALPLIPIHLRPKRGLANYHILWEAEWTPIAPRDPYLLRRLDGDLWLVVAAWDLTEVERAAMATRMSA